MKNITKWAIPAVAALIGLNAQAVTVNGEIDMAGNVQVNSQNLATASAASSVSVTTIGTETGTYAGVTPNVSGVTFHGFSFNSGAITPLWQFVGTDGKTYAFNLTSSTEVSSSAFSVQLQGIGTLTITGDTSSTGNWTFDISDASGGNSGQATFTFQDSNFATPTPDSGTTVMLLGGALTGLGLLKRKLMA